MIQTILLNFKTQKSVALLLFNFYVVCILPQHRVKIPKSYRLLFLHVFAKSTHPGP